MLRRTFLGVASKVTLVIVSMGMGLYSLARALVPDILYEPSAESPVGRPEAFPEGVTFIADRRLFVVREGNDFYAMSAVCSHLGCTVNYVPLAREKEIAAAGRAIKERWEFSCPCHGSKYYSEGTNYAGPAPRPLRRWFVDLSPVTGELIVNTSRQMDSGFRVKL